MAPMLREGDSVLIKYENEDIRVGDIIVFGSPKDFCIHRVVCVRNNDGMDTFTVKGDLSNDVHPPISRDQILGKVIEVHGLNGHIRFDSTFWRGLNYLLWLRSYISLGRRQTDSVFWKATNAIFLFWTKFFPRQGSISLILIIVICWLNRVWPDMTHFQPRKRTEG